MSHTIQVTVGDNGLTLSGTLSGAGIAGLSSIAGYSVVCSLLAVDGGANRLVDGSAVLGALDTVRGTIPVSYKLQTADVAAPAGRWKVRWTLRTPTPENVHFPGALDRQTFLVLNA